MWIQEWIPKTFVRDAIWQENPNLYLGVWRSSGRGYYARLQYHIGTRLINSSLGGYQFISGIIQSDIISYTNRSRELNKTWDQIMENPSAFLLRQML